MFFFFFFQAEDGIRDYKVTGVQTCALPISARPHEDEVPWMGDDREFPGCRDEQEMNRLSDDGALRHLDVGAVLEERGIQGDERIVLELRVPGEMLLEGFRLRSENLGERRDADAFRERPQVGETRRIPTVHEDELTGLQDPEREGLEVLGDHAAGPA